MCGVCNSKVDMDRWNLFYLVFIYFTHFRFTMDALVVWRFVLFLSRIWWRIFQWDSKAIFFGLNFSIFRNNSLPKYFHIIWLNYHFHWESWWDFFVRGASDNSTKQTAKKRWFPMKLWFPFSTLRLCLLQILFSPHCLHVVNIVVIIIKWNSWVENIQAPDEIKIIISTIFLEWMLSTN